MRERTFGLERVLEPAGVFPPVAWKLDNDRKLRPGEARIRLEMINIEWDSFQQICSSCSYDEDKIKARILDIIEKRGKLHNPFTRSGGVLSGTVEEIHPDFHGMMDIETGEKIYCITSLGCLPISIDRIHRIDYEFGQIYCDGYAIHFEANPIYKPNYPMETRYALTAIDEAGSLYGTYRVATENNCRNVVIIGNNLHTMMFYAATIREAIGPQYHVIAVIGEDYNDDISRKEIKKVLKPLFREVYFADFREPVKAYQKLAGRIEPEREPDLVIITDDVSGTETLGVQMVKPNGCIYFSSIDNNYSSAVLCAESIGKVVNTYAFDQYIEGYLDFTMQILQTLRPKLKEIDQLYGDSKRKSRITRSRANTMALEQAGRDDGFIYQDIVTRGMVEEVMNVARYDCNVIIQGETGVGKEKVLELIHQNSERHSKPCIKINCATIAESLAESEFFGYEPGSFTGAQASGKAGYFEMANEGILFLDEIGTLSLNMQSKLLRVIQENTFYRVGGTKPISVNVRVICANNVPLRQLVDEGKFREDLYYRLNICTIDVPPLRERRADILVLAEAFVKNCNRRYGTDKEMSPGALSSLYDYYWPGNVRELENVVHRLVIRSVGNVIASEDVDAILNENAYGDLVKSIKKVSFTRRDNLDFRQLMEQQEKQIIEYALKKERTTRKAAELLGLPQTTLARKKLKYGL